MKGCSSSLLELVWKCELGSRGGAAGKEPQTWTKPWWKVRRARFQKVPRNVPRTFSERSRTFQNVLPNVLEYSRTFSGIFQIFQNPLPHIPTLIHLLLRILCGHVAKVSGLRA